MYGDYTLALPYLQAYVTAELPSCIYSPALNNTPNTSYFLYLFLRSLAIDAAITLNFVLPNSFTCGVLHSSL